MAGSSVLSAVPASDRQQRQSLSSGRAAVPSTGSGTGAGRLPGTLRCCGRIGARRAAWLGQQGRMPLCKLAVPPHLLIPWNQETWRGSWSSHRTSLGQVDVTARVVVADDECC